MSHDQDGAIRRWAGRAIDKTVGLPPAPIRLNIRRDLATPMRDGVSLSGDLYRPADTHGPTPVVLLRLPYGRAGMNGMFFAATLARHGFCVFIQSTRGTFGSGGQFRPFATEHEDGLDTLAWLRDQPWCDGRIAMTGGSYFGHTQWAIAPYADPGLVCISPHICASRISRAFYEHGAPALTNALNWTAQIGRQEHGRIPPVLPNPARTRRIRRALESLPVQSADVAVAGAPVTFWRDFVEHSSPSDPFWDTTDHGGVDMARLPPATMVTGWWDLFLPGQLDDFVALRAAGNPARIVVGPWMHAEPAELAEIMRGDVAWLEHHLHGGPAPAGAPVRVALMQAEQWLEFDQWPPAESVSQVHYLAADGTLGTTPRPGGSSRFRYDPDNPTPNVGGPMLQAPGKQADNGRVEQRDDVLVFTGGMLSADLDAVGPIRAQIQLRTSRRYADIFVRLCDVDGDGVSRNVVDGIRRLDPRTVPAPDVSVAEDGTLTVDVELFPTAYRFRAGHRLRVQLSGGAFPRYARNLGTGEHFASAAAGFGCDFEVLHDVDHPSSVTLTVLPGAGSRR